MAGGLNGVVIRFLADTGSAVRDIRKLERAMGQTGTMAKRTGAMWTNALKPALVGGALAAGAAAGAAVVKGVQSAIEDQSSQAGLAQAMKNTVGATADQIAGMEEYVDAAQRRAAVDDGEVRKGLSRLLRSTKDVTRAQNLMNTALEISAATGKPVAQVVEALAKYNDGNTGALKRLGVTMGEQTRNYGEYVTAVNNLKKAEDLAAAARETYGPKSKEYAAAQAKVAKASERIAQIKGNGGVKWLSELNDQFKGSVASKMDTTAGSMQNVATAADELLEALGVGVLGKDDRASSEMNDLADAMYDAQPSAEAIGSVIHDIAISLAEAGKWIGPLAEGFERINNLGDGVLTNGTIATVMQAISGDFNPIVPGYATGGPAPQGSTQALIDWAAQNGPVTTGYDQYRPMRTTQRYRDATRGADARAAQRDARTRTHP